MTAPRKPGPGGPVSDSEPLETLEAAALKPGKPGTLVSATD